MVFTYFLLFTGYDDDVVQVISDLHIEKDQHLTENWKNLAQNQMDPARIIGLAFFYSAPPPCLVIQNIMLLFTIPINQRNTIGVMNYFCFGRYLIQNITYYYFHTLFPFSDPAEGALAGHK